MSKFNDQVREARGEVDEAIEALERVPRNYGGHLERDASSTIDGTERDHVVHRDGRVMRFDSMVDSFETPYPTALCVYRGRWLVVPAYKLRSI